MVLIIVGQNNIYLMKQNKAIMVSIHIRALLIIQGLNLL
jgi:hypothetical protein